MRNLFSKLWKDDAGLVTLEYLIAATILALGLIVGVTGVTAAINAELTELANAILNLNQSYSTAGFSNCVSGKGGSNVSDTSSSIPITFAIPDAGSIDASNCVP